MGFEVAFGQSCYFWDDFQHLAQEAGRCYTRPAQQLLGQLKRNTVLIYVSKIHERLLTLSR